MKTLFVVNPHSAGGSTGRRWPTLKDALQSRLEPFETRFTQRVGHATEMVQEALVKGTDRIIAVGGDGTTNEVVNGFFDESGPLREEAVLGFVPRGTGGDLRRTLGIGPEVGEVLEVMTRGRVVLADVGRTRFVDHLGRKTRRLFLNVTSFGMGGLVDAKVNASSKALGGKVSFILGTLRALAEYHNKRVHLRGFGPAGNTVMDESLVINNVAVANGQYFGGGMWIAPDARIDDGLLDMVVFGDITRVDVLLQSPRIYLGNHIDYHAVRTLRVCRLEASSADEVLIDMDGEQPGRLPFQVEVLPRAIRLLVPAQRRVAITQK